MSWNLFKARLRRIRGRGRASFALPRVVLEIEPDFVVGARLGGAARPLRSMQMVALQSRALEPLPNRPNVTSEEELRRAIRAVADVVGNGPGRLGLLVPDGAVRVAILPFETLPDDSQEAEALVRWRMRENLPFPPEEARLSYQVSWREPELVEVFALAARNSVLAEYESLLEQINGGPMLILPATVALLPLLGKEEGAGQLLIHVCSGWFTTVVVVDNRPRFWKTRQAGGMEAEDLAREVSHEAARVLASSRDHLKVEVGRVWLCARPPASAEMALALGRAIGREVELLGPGEESGAALPLSERTLFERFGAPVAGLLSNSG